MFDSGYNIVLTHPNLPLVDLGGAKKRVYVPMEVCIILEKQPYLGKLPPSHTAEMRKSACKGPNFNASAIVNRGLGELGYAQSVDPLMAFGMTVVGEMAVVPGRILPSPGIRYSQSVASVDDRASWIVRGVMFVQGGRLGQWAVLNIRDRGRADFDGAQDPELKRTVEGFADMCRKSGVAIAREAPAYVSVDLPPKNREDPLRKAAVRAIQNAMMQVTQKPAMFLVVLSSDDAAIYEGLKHLCDVLLGVATVCVQVEKFRREKGQLQYFANVALKVNMKMGGVNHKLDDHHMKWLRSEPTMLVGMAVTHPQAGQALSGTPSISAVTASVDIHFGQFPASIRIQQSSKEVSVAPFTENTRYVDRVTGDHRSRWDDGGATYRVSEAQQEAPDENHHLPRRRI